MDLYHRMIFQNKYTRDQIQFKTGKRPKRSIVCVGNELQRVQLEKNILAKKSLLLFGPIFSGRMTAFLEIADRCELDYMILTDDSVGSTDFDDMDGDTVLVLRAKNSNTIKKLVKEDRQLVIISDEYLKVAFDTIVFNAITEQDRNEYKTIKGYDIPYPFLQDNPTIRKRISKMLRKGIEIDEMPDSVEQWLAVNFYKNKKLLRLCSLASTIKDKRLKHKLINSIKYKKPISLKRPPWAKTNVSR